MQKTVSFRLNGKPVQIQVESERTLLWVLRSDLSLTGTKYGCGISQCGACTVLIDNHPTRTCTLSAWAAEGKDLVTIEGLEKDGELHPLQKAFVAHDALQCGFCTPGMIMTAYGLLNRIASPTRQQVIDGMEENLCRCGAHARIIDAILEAAANMKGESK